MKWAFFIIVAAAIGFAAWLWATQGVQVRTALATKGTIRTYVDERAKTTLPKTHKITMPLTGRIKPILLLEGASVKKDEVVAEMEASDLRTTVAEGEAKVKAIEWQIKINQYNEMEKTALKDSDNWIKSFAEAVSANRKKVDASKQMAQFAKDYEKTIIESGSAVSRINQTEAKMKAAVAQVDLEAAELNCRSMETCQLMMNLLPLYIRQFLEIKTLNSEVLSSQLAEARETLEKAKRDLGKALIKSPVDGVVLKRCYSDERVLQAGTVLLDIGEMRLLEVTADILSQDVTNIKVGDEAEISGPSIGAEPVKGKVSRIKPEGFTKVSSLGVEEQRVPVVVAFEPASLEGLAARGRALSVGYRVQTRVYTAKRDGALIVPRTALFRGDGGKWHLFMAANNIARLVDVDVGLSNDIEAEITKGLKEGDAVIVAPPTSLSDGARLQK